MPETVATDRLDVWRDVIREHFVALDILADRADSFGGSVRSTDVGLMNIARVESGTSRYTRTPQLADRDDDAYLQVGLLARGAAAVQQDGREAVLAPGDFAVYETDRPFHWAMQGEWELLVFTWPRASVRLGDTASRLLTARCLCGSEGVGAIVARMLRDLAAAPPDLSVEGGVELGHDVLALVTTVAGERVRPTAPERSAEALLRRIDAYIVERLSDPNLTPPDIAEAHFISTRHLHRLFAGRGTTVSHHVQHLRLERARVELRHPSFDLRSITDISRRWGFADLATFSRVFKQAYDLTPTQYRNGR